MLRYVQRADSEPHGRYRCEDIKNQQCNHWILCQEVGSREEYRGEWLKEDRRGGFIEKKNSYVKSTFEEAFSEAKFLSSHLGTNNKILRVDTRCTVGCVVRNNKNC